MIADPLRYTRVLEERTTMSASSEKSFWGRNAKDWIAIQEPLHRPLYDALLDSVALPPGSALLDAGCGSGVVSLLATQHGIAVTGVDVSQPFIDIARKRVPDASFVVGDFQELPFEDASFDGLIASNSLQFVPDRFGAMQEAARVLRRGGRAAIAVFDAEEKCDGAKPIAAMLSLLQPAVLGTPGPFALSAPGQLEALLNDTGFVCEEVRFVETPWVYANRDVAVRAFLSAGPGTQARLAVGAEKLLATLQSAVEPYCRVDGSYRLENVFKIVVGRKA